MATSAFAYDSPAAVASMVLSFLTDHDMGLDEWLLSDDAVAMLEHFRAAWRGEPADLDRLLLRYYLQSCRRIWNLLPMDESRACIEVRERHFAGKATDDELRKAGRRAEGAAVCFLDGFEDLAPQKVATGIEAVRRVSPVELRELRVSATLVDYRSIRDLLAHASYLVVLVASYPNIRPIDNIERTYGDLLSAALLREIVVDSADLKWT